MNVLSLFDGMSCGQIALNRIGIKIDNYYASEVEANAIAETKANFPKTIHIGDVRNINPNDYGHIDLIIGGSPCQSFSFAGKQNGMSTKTKEEIFTLQRYLELKEQNFEFEGQSYLFWEYVRILKAIQKINPNVKFLLENVLMQLKWEKIITKSLNVAPIRIDSALVSAQTRKRLYWTNIKGVSQPDDKKINLVDILETHEMTKPAAIKGQYVEDGKITRKNNKSKMVQCLYVRKDVKNKAYCVTVAFADKTNVLSNLPEGHHIDVYNNNYPYRKYTLKEFCRLQTVPDDYFKVSSKSAAKKMLGNGWTVDVVAHILKNIFHESKYENYIQ